MQANGPSARRFRRPSASATALDFHVNKALCFGRKRPRSPKALQRHTKEAVATTILIHAAIVRPILWPSLLADSLRQARLPRAARCQ
eukprot:scaffold121408_cov30-Tisochrysis_lutea.AAC.13